MIDAKEAGNIKRREVILIDKKTIIIGVVILLVIGCFVYVYCGRNNDGRADTVRNDLQSAEQHNDAAIDQLAGAKQAANDLEAANKQLADTSAKLSTAQQELERLAQQDRDRIAANQKLIDEGKRIVNAVRERDTAANKKP